MKKVYVFFLKKKINLILASRTDKGVHAFGQVAHFNYENTSISTQNIKQFCNFFFKKKYQGYVRIKKCIKTNANFHARFSAKYKEYMYLLYVNTQYYYVFQNKLALFTHKKINFINLNKCLSLIIGMHDFKSFVNTDKSKKQQEKYISYIKNAFAIKKENKIKIFITGTHFYYKQIRNILGAILKIENQNPLIFKKIFREKNRNQNFPTISPDGLYLNKVIY